MEKSNPTLNFYVIPALFFPIFGVGAAVLSQTTSTQSIRTWELLLLGSIAATIILGVIYFRQNDNAKNSSGSGTTSGSTETGYRIGRSLMLIAVFVLLFPSIISRLISVRMQISLHGNEHAGYIFQILNSISPPENQTFPGSPADGYWLFHALIAAVTKLTGLAPTLVATLIHAIVLVLTFFVMREIVSLLLPAQRRYGVLLILTLFALFGMNPLGSLHWLALNGSGGLAAANLIQIRPVALFGISRLTHLLTYYLAISGFALGVLCYLLTILFILRILNGDGRALDVLFGLTAAFGTFAFHPVTGVYIFSVLPTAVIATYLANAYFKDHLFDFVWHKQQAAHLAGKLKDNKSWTIALTIMVLGVGLVWFRFLFKASSSMGLSPGIDLISLRQVLSIFSMTSLLIPLFLIGVYKIYKKPDPLLIFPVMICFFGFLLAYFARLFNNEYKFIYLSTIALTIICTFPLEQFVFGKNSKEHVAGKAYGILLLSLMFFNILTIGSSRLLNPAVREDNFILTGTHVESRFAYEGALYPEPEIEWIEGDYYPTYDLIYADAYQWARDNSETQAILVLPFFHKDNSTMLLVSERLPYVVDGYFFNNGLPGYQERVRQIKTIYSTENSWADKAQAIAEIAETFPDRQLLLLYPNTLKDMPENVQENGLTPLYQGRYADLYQITR